MSVPAQVQAKADAADQLQQGLNGETPENGTADPAPPQEGTAPVVPPNGQEPPPADPNPIQPVNNDDITQKYNSLLGRCEAQVSEMKQLRSEKDLLYKQVSDLNRKIFQLEQQLTELKTAKPEPTVKDPETQDNGPQPLDIDAYMQYGEQFGKMAETLNQMIAGLPPANPEPAPQPPEPQPNTPQTVPANPEPAPSGISVQQLESDLVSDVYMIHKLDFNQINPADEFLSWLDQFDSVTGQQHLGKWREAVQARDKALCLQVINTFLESPSGQAMTQRLGAKPEPSPAPNQQPNISTPNQDPATVPETQQGNPWHGSEIMDFYTLLSMGKFSPEQVKMHESEIQQAQVQGTVIPGEAPNGGRFKDMFQ